MPAVRLIYFAALPLVLGGMPALAEPVAVPAAGSALGAPIAQDQLGAMRGTGGVAMTTTLGGTVNANSANQVTTGDNIIQASSFAGATGVPVVIQNTGANVLIQNATVINLELK